jgi:hypothetical protein
MINGMLSLEAVVDPASLDFSSIAKTPSWCPRLYRSGSVSMQGAIFSLALRDLGLALLDLCSNTFGVNERRTASERPHSASGTVRSPFGAIWTFADAERRIARRFVPLEGYAHF